MKNSGNIISGKYSLKLTILVFLIAAVSLTLGWIAFRLQAWITFYNVLLLWFVLLAVLLFQIRKVNRDLARFFEVIEDQDTIQQFDPSKSGGSFAELYRQMNRVIDKLAGLRSEKEKEYHFFRSIFDNADAGLMVFDEQGKIKMFNKTAGTLLGLMNPGNISETPVPSSIRPGIKKLLKFKRGEELVQLSIRNRKIRVNELTLNLLSLQNIKQELEQHEIETWQKLIRVFIHEILNSVSPITLTSSGIITMIDQDEALQTERKTEILEGLKAIRKRSKGLSAFMDSYRQLSRAPVPDFSNVPAEKLIGNVALLMQKDFQQRNIKFICNLLPAEIRIWCDEKLIEQVLINLLKNAADALTESPFPEISLSCVELTDRTEITIEDNGPGIDPEIIDNIFVPYFTTKPDGTGIGLSLSRQIMNLHGGTIFVHSKKGNTKFILNIPL